MHQRPPADPAYSEDMATTAGPTAGQTEMMAPVDDDYYYGDAADGTAANHSTFDDVFGEEENDHGHLAAAHHSEPSDMNRLRHDHATAGYREGLAEAKAASVQVGFDEGYGLGAALGREVGELLGLVEGVASAAAAAAAAGAGAGAGVVTDVASLLARARQELTVVAVFGKEYFAPDGTWLYNVETADDGATASATATILDVARAHPLVRTWRGLVDGQLRRHGVRWGDAGSEAALAASLGLGEGEEEGEEATTAAAMAATAPATAPAPAAITTTSARPPTTALDW